MLSLVYLLLALLHLARSQGILVFSKATAYQHESIPTAIEAIKAIGAAQNISTLASNDSSIFSDASLSSLSVVAFLSNSEPNEGPAILNETEQAAFLRWLARGGGFVGIHAASACLLTVPWYKVLIGAIFDYHPTLQSASFFVTNASSPGVSGLPSPWTFVEEVYSFYSDPRQNNVSLTLTVDNTSYSDPDLAAYQAQYNQGTPHPIGWHREASSPGVNLGNGTFHPGRMWYTSLGHTTETWQNATFLSHIEQGLLWVLEASANATWTNDTAASASAAARQVAAALPTQTMSISAASHTRTLCMGLLSLVVLSHAF